MEWVQGQGLKDKLNALLSPRLLDQFGVQWRGDSSWVETGDCAVRRIIRLVPLKGLDAVVWWGYSLSFVPRVSGTRLTYHRTVKAACLDVFEWPESYARSFTIRTSFERVDLHADKFERSLLSYFDAEIPRLASWFGRVHGLDGIEQELRRQIANPAWAYRVRSPHPAYVLPLVVAALGRIAEADDLAQSGFDDRMASLLPKLRLSLHNVPLIAVK